MANPKAKTISLLLEEGTLKGVISMADSSWNKGELYSAPRDNADDLITSDACSRYGVYLLLSEDMVYIGQSSDLSKRIKQHIIGKPWWERVVVLTTSDDSLNRSDIDYIEASLISKANKIGKLDCDNKTMGNKQKVNKFRQVELEQYLDEALFLLELIGISVFCETEKKQKTKKDNEFISSIKNSTQDQIEIRAKKEALVFLAEKGLSICKNMNYAKLQPNKPEFWLNPQTHVLDEDWDIALNDLHNNELILIHVPAKTFSMRTKDKPGLIARSDMPHRIDLNIKVDTLVDRRSKCDFSTCKITRVKY